MNVKYFGKKTLDSFGNKLAKPLPPVAVVTYKESETEKALERIRATGYEYDSYNEGGECFADVYVDDLQDFRDFMREWRCTK